MDDDEEIELAYQYAFRKLGYLVTEANRHLFTPEQLEAWDQALTEFEEVYDDEAE